jgi:hypothetical protein
VPHFGGASSGGGSAAVHAITYIAPSYVTLRVYARHASQSKNNTDSGTVHPDKAAAEQAARQDAKNSGACAPATVHPRSHMITNYG